VFSVTEIYNPQANTWRRGPAMLTGRAGTQAAVIGDKFYIPGGSLQQGSEVAGVHEVFLAQTGTLYFPHVPMGGGLSTELILTNPSDATPALGVLEFFSPAGEPVPVTINGQSQSRHSYVVPPYGATTVRLQAVGDEPLRVLYGVASTDVAMNGNVLFRSGPSLAGVDAGVGLRRFITPVQVDEAGQLNTGLALANPGSDPAALVLALRDERGAVQATASLTLAPRSQTARFITEWFPGVRLSDFRGTLTGTSTANVAGVALLVGGTQITSLPLRGE